MITLPDTALTRATHQLLTAYHPAWLVNHSLRTFGFGRAALEQGHPTVDDLDAELLLVASLLHDIALGGPLDDAGLRLSRLDPEVVEAVLTTYPRTGATIGLVQVLTHQIATKPGSRVATLDREVNLLAAIAAAPFSE